MNANAIVEKTSETNYLSEPLLFPNKAQAQKERKNRIYSILLEEDLELKESLWRKTEILLDGFFQRKKDQRKKEKIKKQLKEILNSEGITDVSFIRKRTAFLKEVY